MDTLNNYSSLMQTIADINQAQESAVSEKKAEAQEKIKEFTQPFEEQATQHLTDFLIGRTIDLAGKLGVTEAKAKRYANAYKQSGARGVLDEASRDLESFRNRLPARKISELPLEDFDKVRSITKKAIDADVQKLNPVERGQFRNILQQRVASADEIPDNLQRFQTNQQHAMDALEQVKSSQLQSQITRVAGDAEDEFGQGLKSTTSVFRNTIPKEAESLAQKAESTAEKAKTALSDVAKVGSDVAEDAAAGAEGGPLGDIIGGVIGLGTALGGLFSARKAAHHIAPARTLNFAIQEGA